MFLKALFATLLAASTLLANIAFADQLTAVDIQRIWTNQGVLKGTYRTSNADGTVDAGTFTLHGSESLVLNHEKTGGVITFDQYGYRVEDTRFPGNGSNHTDIRFGIIFGEKPSFASHVNSGGRGPKATMLGFAGSEGAMRVFFSNETGRLIYLAFDTADGKTAVTEFTYE